MKKKLTISPGELLLPLETVTETVAIVGIRGSGKTNTAVVTVEELLDQGQQVLIIDPTDVWWGLKSSADGRRAGYPVVILGGQHGDLPLGAGDGATIADFVVDSGASIICSLRHFESKAMQRRFVTALAQRLYYRKGQTGKQTPLMVVIDEASLFVPQRVGAAEAEMVGAIQQLVRQGRSSGFGVTLIDQRPATINKDVLTQLELLVAHRISSPQDRKAIEAWVEQHDTADRGGEFLRSIASLKRGIAWFWSPGWLDVFKPAAVRKRRTFDSSRTPAPGEVLVQPKKLAEVDLEKLKAQLSATIDQARAADPAVLRRENIQLKANIAELERRKPAITIQKPAMMKFPAGTLKQVTRLVEKGNRLCEILFSGRQEIRAGLESITRALTTVSIGKHPLAGPRPVIKPAAIEPERRARPISLTPRAPLPKAERRILTALAQFPAGRTKAQAAVMSGYALGGGGFNNAIGALRTAGLITRDGDLLRITPEGLGVAGDVERLPTGPELVRFWMSQLGKAEREILQAVAAVYPDGLDKATIGERTGYTPGGGGFNNALGRLRTLQLVTGKDIIKASDDLFQEAA